MMSSPLRFERVRAFALAGSMAMLVGSTIACTAGAIGGGGPGTAKTGSAGSTGVGTGVAGGSPTGGPTGVAGAVGTGAAGAGGVGVVDPGMPTSTSWYDNLTATNCAAPPTALPATRIWRLSATQWKNTVTAALGVAAPDVSSFPLDQVDPRTGYSDDSTGDKITLPLANSYFNATDSLGGTAATAAIAATPCLGTAPIAAACAQTFVTSMGAKLWRRPLAAAEVTSYANYLVAESKLDPAATALGSAIKAMMLSPNFLFRTELGGSTPGQVTLTNDEIASLLSYSIADVPPDATLQGVSAQLGDPTVRQTQAERLALLPGAKDKLTSFWREYRAIGDQPSSPGTALSAFNEANLFFTNVVFGANGTLKDLLTAPYTYVTPTDTAYAATYGTAKPDATTGKLMLDPTQRAGFLTSVAMLSKTSAPSQAATVIHRGLLVRERVLCQIPPPPPASVVPDPTQIQMAGPNATARQNYTQFTMDHQSCNACHSFFQPLGLAFEAYDANGKFRTQYPAPISMPIDTTGTLDSAGDAAGAYNDVVGMATKLGGSQMAQYCIAQQFAEYAFGRSVSIDQEGCTIRSMGDYVTGKGGQMRALLASFAATPTVTRRFHQ
jgi:hypothetical protein